MTEPLAWHQALAYAVTGRRWPELGRQSRPDLAALTQTIRERRIALCSSDQPLPEDLGRGIGAAQFAAAVLELRRALGGPAVVAVRRERPLTRDEQAWVADRPPHHGG